MHAETVTWVAIAGVVIAASSLGWHIWNVVRDKAKITIKCRPGMKPVGGLETIYDSNKTYLAIKVINKGRRPVKISQAGLKLKGTTYWSVSADCFYPLQNRTLTEENPSTNFMVEQEGIDLGNIDFVWAIDATGRMYKNKYKKRFQITRRLKMEWVEVGAQIAIAFGFFASAVALAYNVKAVNLQRAVLHTELFVNLRNLQINHMYKQPRNGKQDELISWCRIASGIFDHICFILNRKYLSPEMTKSFEPGIIEYRALIKGLDPSIKEDLGHDVSEEIESFYKEATKR